MATITTLKLFKSRVSKSHDQLAGDMAAEIKEVIYTYSQRVPLALAIGVLRIVEKEILEGK